MHHGSPKNIAIVSESVAEDPNVSIPRQSQELLLFYDTLYSILHLDLHLGPYKVQLIQHLKPADHSQRRRNDGRQFFEQNFLCRYSTFTLTEYVNMLKSPWSSM